jgi:short-subunit dehydrogenase
LDIADAAGCYTTLEKFTSSKPVSAAIINHGIGQYGRFAHSPWEDLATVLRTNLIGGVAVARAVLPAMLSQDYGSIVFISTILDKRPIPNHAAYSASKSGLRTLANVLRMETRGTGVHVGVVSPSRTTTDFSTKVLYSEPPSPSVVNIASPPSRAAEAIFRCVSKKRREITVSFTGKTYTFLGYHFPRLADWVISKIVPKPGATGNE